MELGSNGIQNKGSGAPKLDGVLFKTIEPVQYTSFQTGDEGWRVQNGFYNYTPPTNPKVIAELDFSIGANYFWKLKNPLIVNGVSSTERFVDLNGTQIFSATNNRNIAVIDKLTGMMFTRTDVVGVALSWSLSVSEALIYSVVINSVTYDDWFLISMPEIVNVIQIGNTTNFQVDPITSATILNYFANVWHTASTFTDNTGFDYVLENVTVNKAGVTLRGKNNWRQIYIRNARNLITAP
jgi:hypothetical protein